MELTHFCPRCKTTKPLSDFSITKTVGYKLQADGNRYKLDMCKVCRKEYNAEKKRDQRTREAIAIAEAEHKGFDYALLPIQSKAPLAGMKGSIIGKLRRLKIDK